jgi:hypothetical protein
METQFIPTDFEVPLTFDGSGFRLEPLGPIHNERDHEAWMTSIEHVRATPGMGGREWPAPMTLADNLADLEMHSMEFADRQSFTYSILEGESVIGCVYIVPGHGGHHAEVRSWVRESKSDMDLVVWQELSEWLVRKWPFRSFVYSTRI